MLIFEKIQLFHFSNVSFLFIIDSPDHQRSLSLFSFAFFLVFPGPGHQAIDLSRLYIFVREKPHLDLYRGISQHFWYKNKQPTTFNGFKFEDKLLLYIYFY